MVFGLPSLPTAEALSIAMPMAPNYLVDASCARALCVNQVGARVAEELEWRMSSSQWDSRCVADSTATPPDMPVYCGDGFIWLADEGCVQVGGGGDSPPGLTTTELDVHNCRWTGHGSGFSVSPCTYLIQHSDDITIEDFWQDAAPEYNWKVGDLTQTTLSSELDSESHCTIKEYNPLAGWEYTYTRCIETRHNFVGLGADGALGKLNNCAGTASTPWHSQTVSLTDILGMDAYILDYRQQYSDYRGGGGSGGATAYYDEGGYYFPRDPTCSSPRPNEFRLDFRHNAEEKYLPNSQDDLQLTTDSEMWILIPQYSDLTLFEGGVQDSYEVVNVDGITYYKFNMGRIQQESSPNVCADPGQAVSCLGGGPGHYSQEKLNLRKWDAVAGDRRVSII